jgi:hypothetical protein
MELNDTKDKEYKSWLKALKIYHKLCRSNFKSLKNCLESLAKEHNYALNWNYSRPILIDQGDNRLSENELFRLLVATNNWSCVGHEFLNYFWYLEIFRSDNKWEIRRGMNLVGRLKVYSKRPKVLIMNPISSYEQHERIFKEKIVNIMNLFGENLYI